MDTHPAALPLERLLDQCEIRRLRRGGPGGQHRNKVETAVVVTHRPTGLVGEASERRSQSANQARAVWRLRLRLAVEVRSADVTPPIQPSALWRSRTPGRRIRVNPEHDDFPSLLAEALDVLTAAKFDTSAAAAWLGVTATQLHRFLQQEPIAWARLNDQRRQCGLRPLG